MPVRGSRKVYAIPNLVRRPDENGNLVYQTGLVKIKQPIGNALGISSLILNNSTLYRTVTRNGVTYTVPRGLGGYRVKSWKLVANTTFSIGELIQTAPGQPFTAVTTLYKSISIGCPAGVSLNRFCRFILGTTGNLKDQVNYVVTPDGMQRPLVFSTEPPNP